MGPGSSAVVVFHVEPALSSVFVKYQMQFAPCVCSDKPGMDTRKNILSEGDL